MLTTDTCITTEENNQIHRAKLVLQGWT